MSFLRNILKILFPAVVWPYFVFIKNFIFEFDSVNLKKINFFKKNTSIIVVGNGPSLKKDIEYIVSVADKNDFFCVNYFANTEFYEKLKPNKYVFIDYGLFFSSEVPKCILEKRKQLLDKINRDTVWDMQIFIPMYADINLFKKIINNKNIKIIKMNIFNINFNNRKKAIKKYSNGFYGPSGSNVLIYAIYLSVWANYKEVKVFGADLSYIDNLYVDQRNNYVVTKAEHFYSSGETRRILTPPFYKEGVSMASEMLSLAKTHKAHDLINDFSKYKNVKIFNCSSYSLIDSYDRLRY